MVGACLSEGGLVVLAPGPIRKIEESLGSTEMWHIARTRRNVFAPLRGKWLKSMLHLREGHKRVVYWEFFFRVCVFVRRRHPQHSGERKGGTPALRLAWHFPRHRARPFQALLCPNTYLHYMPQCEVTPADFANCMIPLVWKKVLLLCADVLEFALWLFIPFSVYIFCLSCCFPCHFVHFLKQVFKHSEHELGTNLWSKYVFA